LGDQNITNSLIFLRKKRYTKASISSFISHMNDKGGIFIIKNNYFPSQMNVGLKKVESNQGTRFTYEPDRWCSSLHILELITLDPDIRFGKTKPRWKENLERKTMG
jgi:hypothetical protein